MKSLPLFCIIAMVAAAPPRREYNNPDNVQLLQYENENFGNGRHRYSFEQSDGTKQKQEGELKNKGGDDEVYTVNGSYTWVGPDGMMYTVNYVADENGYQPEIEEGPGAGFNPNVVASLIG